MAKVNHPRGLNVVWPHDSGPTVRRYGTIAGYPLMVRCWRVQPPPETKAVQIDRDVWIQLDVIDPIALDAAMQVLYASRDE